MENNSPLAVTLPSHSEIMVTPKSIEYLHNVQLHTKISAFIDQYIHIWHHSAHATHGFAIHAQKKIKKKQSECNLQIHYE